MNDTTLASERRRKAHLMSESCGSSDRVRQVKSNVDESAAAFAKRTQAAYDQEFIGAHAQNEVVLHNSNPTGSYQAAERLEAATTVGGIRICGKSGNCQVVCPQKIPLMTSWARMGRAATLHVLKQWFGPRTTEINRRNGRYCR